MEKSPIKFIWYYVKIFKWFFLIIFTLIIISTIGGQLYPLYLAKIYDTAAGKVGSPTYWEDIIRFTCIGFGFGLIKVLGFELSLFLTSKIYPQAETLVVRDAFDHVNKLSIAYFNQEMSGKISEKVSQLRGGVMDTFQTIWGTSQAFIFLIFSVIILSAMNVFFCMAMMFWLTIVILTARVLGKKRLAMSKSTSKQRSLANGVIVDSLSNYSEIKSFANFRFERLNLLRYLRMLRKAETKEEIIKTGIHLALNIITVFSMLGFMFLAIWVFRNKQITTTEFIYANTLFAMIASMVFDVTWGHSNLSRSLGMVKSALETLAVEPDIKDKPKAKKMKIRKAEISFENVEYAYNDKQDIFNNLSLNIKAGEKIGLVGHSGSGKSTFIKLIARYYDVRNGAIKIDGCDIRDITQESLRKNIATIPQDVCLFNRSLKENIRYGKTNATDAEIVKAAKKAFADDFIKDMPNGYETIVGERGVVLSGGERQRIAIARAILKNAPILIFDEATSALDSKSEQHIQKSLAALMKNKTVIAIAHRLSTLREMDRILVFSKGKIIEQGSHNSLLRKKGTYYKLYNMQADGFVGDKVDDKKLKSVL